MNTAAQAKKHLAYRIRIKSDKCQSCKKCIVVCSKQYIIFDEKLKKTRLKRGSICVGCNKCTKVCAYRAIVLDPVISDE
ncbi:MAG: 4Fe-4S dicluster domain-containing protein [Pseudomonadota bacterium]